MKRGFERVEVLLPHPSAQVWRPPDSLFVDAGRQLGQLRSGSWLLSLRHHPDRLAVVEDDRPLCRAGAPALNGQLLRRGKLTDRRCVVLVKKERIVQGFVWTGLLRVPEDLIRLVGVVQYVPLVIAAD